jgi:hypothetical protein
MSTLIKNDQRDTTVWNNLLFHCSLADLHVSSDIIAHQERLNYNYSFWFYSLVSLSAAAMRAHVNKTGNCNYSLDAPDDER